MNTKPPRPYIYNAKKPIIVAIFTACFVGLFLFLRQQINTVNTEHINKNDQSITTTTAPTFSTKSLQSIPNPKNMTLEPTQGALQFTKTQSTLLTQNDLSSLTASSTTFQPLPQTNTSPTSPAPTNQTLAKFTNKGNQAIDINSWKEPLIISLSYQGNGSFKAISRDTSSELIGTLVETNGPYEGRQVINTRGINYEKIDIQATGGTWQVEIQPLNNAVPVTLPMIIYGNNAEVYRIDKMIYELSFNASESNGWVSVIGYGEDNYINVLVNTQVPFTNSITVKDPDIIYLEVVTVGKWALTIK